MLMVSVLGVFELPLSVVSVVVGVSVWKGRMWRLVWRLVGFQPFSFGCRGLGLTGTLALASGYNYVCFPNDRHNYSFLIVYVYAVVLTVGIRLRYCRICY